MGQRSAERSDYCVRRLLKWDILAMEIVGGSGTKALLPDGTLTASSYLSCSSLGLLAQLSNTKQAIAHNSGLCYPHHLMDRKNP